MIKSKSARADYMARRYELLNKFTSIEECITSYLCATQAGDPKRDIMMSIRYNRGVKHLDQCVDLDEFEFQIEKLETILKDIREVSKW